jgi:lipopolysaccharide/colanic/teichoic acid biosynthesis glycosyltransferase
MFAERMAAQGERRQPSDTEDGPLQAVMVVSPGQPTWQQACRAAGERAIAFLLLVLTAPLTAAALLLVRLTSRGPALYRQVRVGRGGVPFTLYKIRTMVLNCEWLTGPCWSLPGDIRVTRVGRFLRRLHLDELPQLWNVLRGEMSLVGPRPERPEFVYQLERLIPRYRERQTVRPGLTGLAQVQLPPDTDLESVRRKLAYDLHYLRHRGPWLDLRLLIATALRVVGVPAAVTCPVLRIPDHKVVERRRRSDRAAATEVPVAELLPGS